MAIRKVHISDIGEVHFVKSKRSRRIGIRIKADAPVRVSLPRSSRYDEAEKFVMQKKDWIIKHQERLNKLQADKFIFTPETNFTTYARSLKMQAMKNFAKGADYQITATEIIVRYPANIPPENDCVQKKVKEAVIAALKKEAKAFLPYRTQYLAEKFNFRYKKVSVRNARTRWGSCSSENNISLNIHLMRLPEHLRDYIILHELCHTVEKNHGKNFWALLDKVSGNAKALAKELKQYHTNI